jgi:hypothetical protein
MPETLETQDVIQMVNRIVSSGASAYHWRIQKFNFSTERWTNSGEMPCGNEDKEESFKDC